MTASSAGRSPWSARTPHRWPGCSARVAGGYRELHADHGVQLQLGTRVAGLRGTGRVEAVVTEDGRTVEGDLVLVGAGAVPRTGLAEAAGFAVRNRVLVNEQLEGVGVYAAGDAAAAWHPGYQRYLRVEHWANARTRARPRPATCSGARCLRRAGDNQHPMTTPNNSTTATTRAPADNHTRGDHPLWHRIRNRCVPRPPRPTREVMT